MRRFLNNLLNIGLRPGYQTWEVFLTRKLNLITFITIFNLSLAILFFYITGYTQFIIHCASALVAAPLVIIANRFLNYIWAAYAFNIFGFIFFFFVNLV